MVWSRLLAKSPERWVRVTKKYGTFQEVFFWVVSVVSTILLHVHPLLFGEDEPILTNSYFSDGWDKTTNYTP